MNFCSNNAKTMKLQIGDYPDLEMSPLDFTIDIHCKKGFLRFLLFNAFLEGLLFSSGENCIL